MKLKDQKLEPLFKRRQEIKDEVNKLMEEYSAIGYIIEKAMRAEEELKRLKASEREAGDEYDR